MTHHESTLSRRHVHRHRAHRRRRLCARHRRPARPAGGGDPRACARGAMRLPHPGEINAWVVIEPDDTVIIRYGRAEMGQGSFTALPQILTEELECDWALVKPEYASANRNFRENKVYGSLWHRRQPRGARDRRSRPAGRRERARAADRRGREALERAAPSECAAAMSKVTHTPTGRTLRYGELAADAAAIKLDKEPAHQDARSVQVHRQAAGAARRAAQDQRHGEIWHRPRGAGHGPRRDHRLLRCSAAR